MKSLLLLRHAKSSWDDAGLRDHDRPLNERGEKAAPRMGALLAELGKVPDLVLSSTAVRARSTAELVAAACGVEADAITLCEDLYLATPGGIVDVVRRKGADAAQVLVVAHNPGLEDLVEALAGRHERFPTGALAALRVDVSSWSDLSSMTPTELEGVWRPKELD